MLEGFFRKWRGDRPTNRISEQNTLVDLAGRIKMSSPLILLNANLTLGKSPLTWDEVISGTATSTWVQNEVCVDMTVSANDDYAIRQTRGRWNYQAGKPMRLDCTGILPKAPGVQARIGMFHSTFAAPYTPLDGVCFETINDVAYCSIYKEGGTTRRVPQSEWNMDKLDGTGPSGMVIDWTKFHLFSIEYEWLGAACVRFSVMLDGAWVPVHDFNNSGVITACYMRNGTQPVRYEIRSTGGTATMRQQCASVISEGGDPGFGIAGCVDNDGSSISVPATERKMILAVRITPDYQTACHQAQILSAYLLNSAANTRFRWWIAWNPVITGTPNWVNFPYSAIDTWTGTGAEAITNQGLIMDAGYADSSLRVVGQESKSALGFGHTIAGVPDVIALCVESVSGTCTISGGIQARQIL